MIIKFSCFLEFHPCMSTYCIRHCLKIANTHIQFAVTEGFLSRSKTSQQYTRWKIRWTSLPGSSVFHPFFLEGKIYESIFIQSVGLLCEMCLYQQKQVQRHTRCFGNRKWEGVLKFFVHVWFCLLVQMGLQALSLPTTQIFVVTDLTGLLGQNHHPKLWLILLITWAQAANSLQF